MFTFFFNNIEKKKVRKRKKRCEEKMRCREKEKAEVFLQPLRYCLCA